MTNVDIFDGIDTNTDDSDVESSNVDATTDDSNVPDGSDDANSTDNSETPPETEDKPVETVSTIPAGAVSVTEFAQFVTQENIKSKILAGEELDGSEYTVPQAVYQTVKAQKDRIPHVLVKAEGETEARVYILKDEAFTWWMARREKLKDRGAGARAASSRTPEENLGLLGQAVQKHLYAKTRLKLWTSNVDKAEKLVEKYRTFLSEASVDSDTMDLAIQEATDAFNAEQAQKAADKAAKSKKNQTTPVAAPVEATN